VAGASRQSDGHSVVIDRVYVVGVVTRHTCHTSPTATPAYHILHFSIEYGLLQLAAMFLTKSKIRVPETEYFLHRLLNITFCSSHKFVL